MSGAVFVDTDVLVYARDRGLVQEDVAALHAWSPFPTGLALTERAWALEDRFGFSWWDAQIVAAALLSGCGHLLTEDLQDGQTVEGLTVVTPFRHEPASLLG
ncbi:MAG: hypothetical protein AMXMBFR53_17590 [Gemmatimonadota bacterium]